MGWREATSAMLDAVLPRRCAACDALSERAVFCPVCSDSLLDDQGPGAGFLFGGALQTAIRRAKFDPDETRGRALATLVDGLDLAAQFGDVDAVTHVPIHQRRYRERGFDLGGLLGARVAGALDRPWLHLLSCTRLVAPLSMSDRARRDEVHGKFALRQTVRAKVVLVVDDVRTTGATLGEAARVLSGDGVEVRTWALCRVPDVDEA